MKTLSSLLEAAKLLSAGKVGVVPTDTLYGLVADARNIQAVERIYELKQRDGKPGTIIAASIDQLVELGLKRRYLQAVQHYWPNSISVEIPHQIEYIHRGTGRSAVRIPDNPEIKALLMRVGALQTSSANLTGKPCATTLNEAQKYFGDKVDFYVDGGDLSESAPSTVIRVVDDVVEVVREGAVMIDKETGKVLHDT